MERYTDHYQALYDYLGTLPIINTHSHELRPEQQVGIGLHEVLMTSYVAPRWHGLSLDETTENIALFTKRLKYNSHFYWMVQGLQKLYGLDLPLNEDTYWEYDRRIREKRKDPTYPDRALQEICGYRHVILDQPKFPGIDNGNPALNKPVFRIDMMLMGHDPDILDHDGRNAASYFDLDRNISFDDYVEFCRNTVQNALDRGCVGLKCAKAYDRSLIFREASAGEARAAFHNAAATPNQIRDFEDYMFYQMMDVANKNGAPVQFHTGLGKMIDSGAKYIRPVIAKYPNVVFDVFHASYPWMDDVCGLVHNYANVRADLCWMPIISIEASVRFIKELVQVGRLNTMMWGSDTFNVEESCGAILAAKKAIARAFAELIEDDMMNMDDAKCFCRHILYQNAADTFHISLD